MEKCARAAESDFASRYLIVAAAAAATCEIWTRDKPRLEAATERRGERGPPVAIPFLSSHCALYPIRAFSLSYLARSPRETETEPSV